MDDFTKLVKAMRTKQREYFRMRTPDVLRECKDLERRVDEAIAKGVMRQSRSLFEDAENLTDGGTPLPDSRVLPAGAAPS